MKITYKSGSGLTLAAILVILFCGCTLTMDDMELPEEELGFDEPIIIQNEYGEATYQYNEGTYVLTPNRETYVATVEDDTILYFMDNTPTEHLPVKNQYVAANCSHTFPMGLNCRVESVEHANGLYRVVLTQATRAEVYKEFNVVYDFDYEPEMYIQAMDSATADSLGLTDEDFVFTDWSLLDGTASQDSTATRADEDKEESIDLFSGKIDIDKFNCTISLDAKYKKKTHIHYEENKAKDMVDQYEIDESSMQINLGANFSKGTDMYDALEKMRKPTVFNDLRDKKTIRPFVIPIPLAGPVGFFLKVAPHYEFSAAIGGEAVVRVNLPKKKQGAKYENGAVVKKYDDKLSNGSFKFERFEINGKFEMGAGVELMLGAGASSGFAGLGVYGDIGIKLNMNLRFGIYGSLMDVPEQDDLLKLTVGLTPGVKFFVTSPSGKEWGSLGYSWDELLFINKTMAYYPKVYKVKGGVKEGRSNDGEYRHISVSTTFDDTGLYTYLKNGRMSDVDELYPYCQLYRGSLESNDYVGLDETNNKALSNYSENHFEYVDRDPIDLYYAVPCLINRKTNEVLQFKNKVLPVSLSQEPMMQYMDLYQVEGIMPDRDDEFNLDFSDDQYKFAAKLNILNGAGIPKHWKDLGIKIKIEGHDILNDKIITLLTKKVSLKNKITKTGTYTFIFDFTTDFYYKPLHYVSVFCELYHVDMNGKETTIGYYGDSNEISWLALQCPYTCPQKYDQGTVKNINL